jgi:hypothetical protein
MGTGCARSGIRTHDGRRVDRLARYYYVVGVIQATCIRGGRHGAEQQRPGNHPGTSAGQVRLHAGDEVEVVEAGGTLQIVRSEGAESRGQRLVRRLRNTATGRDIARMSTDQIMALLRAE